MRTLELRRISPLRNNEEAVDVVRFLGSTLLDAGTWYLEGRRRRNLANMKPEELLRASVRMLMVAKVGVSTHTIRLRRAASEDRFAVVLRVVDGLDAAGLREPGVDLAWLMASDELGLKLLPRFASRLHADTATLGPVFNTTPNLGWVSLIRQEPTGPIPSGARLDIVEERRWIRVDAVRENPMAPETPELMAEVAKWIRGEPEEYEEPRPRVQVAVPTYLLSPAPEPTAETVALPMPDELRRRIAEAEPRVAMRHAAEHAATMLPETPATAGKGRGVEADIGAGETAQAPTPKELSEALSKVLPFPQSGPGGLPMPVDDYAVLSALRIAKGPDDEGVIARYGTRDRRAQRELDRTMRAHIDADPDQRARFEERCRHFLQYLRR